MTKSYSEMLQYSTFKDRLQYLYIGGKIGEATFGSKRWINQRFYTSEEWRRFRREIIIRDNGCDMALDNYPISSDGIRRHRGLILHHISPCTVEDIVNKNFSKILDPENVVCVSYQTHKMIHYGYDDKIIDFLEIERRPNDTCPWKEE